MADLTYATEAELSLAGCLLVEPEQTVRMIQGTVLTSDFLNKSAAAVFSAATALVNQSKPCDPVLIQEAAAKFGLTLSNDFCRDAMERFLTTANAAENARIIHEAALRRQGQQIGLALAEDQLAPIEAVAKLQDLLQSVGSRIHSPAEAAQLVMDSISDAASGKTKPFLSTGFKSLDAQLSGGLVSGGLITLAARPGTGKTTVAINLAEHVAAVGGKVLYISLEMTEEQIWFCRAANISGLSRSAINSGNLGKQNPAEWARLSDAFGLLAERQFLIRDKPSTIEDVEREARCIDGLSLIVIDHIGLLKQSAGQRFSSRYEFITSTSHRLKQLALSMRIPILALCQLNRSSEQRESRRPTMADLRDSGAIEEDSDVVCLLFREGQSLPQEQRPPAWAEQEIDIIVDKNRHGFTGAVTLRFFGVTSRILEKEHEND